MKFLFIVFLFPLQLFAQDITGVWTGTLYNDTTKQYIKYELAISEYNGKLSGYSHTIFVIDGVENIGVKSIKIKEDGESILVTDEKLIYNNYPEPPAKGVKQFSRLLLSQNDSVMILRGSWETNRTREYSKLTGNISLQKKKNIKESLILTKLESLGLTHFLSFIAATPPPPNDLAIANKTQLQAYKTDKKNVVVLNENVSNNITPEKEKNKVDEQKKNDNETANSYLQNTDSNRSIKKTSQPKQKPGVEINQNDIALAKETSNNISAKQNNQSNNEQNKTINNVTEQTLNNQNSDSSKLIKIAPTAPQQKNYATVNNQSEIFGKEKSKNPVPAKEENYVASKQQKTDSNKKKIISFPQIKSDFTVVENLKIKSDDNVQQISNGVTTTGEKNEESKLREQQNKNQLITSIPILNGQKIENTKSDIKIIPAAAELASRKIETINTVEIKQDSLLLTLYDNGEIDGDTVSVLLNGKVIMPRQGLMARAINKTIYLTPEMGDSITLIMYAENLGSIPPNTGLLVVHDGNDVHEIRFSGDLQKSSAIILKRKKQK